MFFRLSSWAFEHIAKFLIEFVHATSGIHDFLFASVEWVALRANLDIEVFFFHYRLSNEFVAARASYVHFVIIWMNILFHF